MCKSVCQCCRKKVRDLTTKVFSGISKTENECVSKKTASKVCDSQRKCVCVCVRERERENA